MWVDGNIQGSLDHHTHEKKKVSIPVLDHQKILKSFSLIIRA
jgi:hypothetical protein